jgi:WD40 repeat protein
MKTARLVTTYSAPAEIWGAAFSPDGRKIAVATLFNTAIVWEISTGKEVCTLKGHSNWVVDVAFSPDGARLLTGSRDNTAKVWEVRTGRELLTLREHERQVIGVAFSPRGDQIATSSTDGTVRLWGAPVTVPRP